MELGSSIKELTAELESREALIEKLKATCIDLKTKISTLRAAEIVMESRARSAAYVGKSFKDIVMSEVERFGVKVEDFVNDTYKGQSDLIENLVQYLLYGTTIKREFREEVCIKASNLFEIDYNVLMNSLEIAPDPIVPLNSGSTAKSSSSKEFIVPKDLGGLLSFNIKRLNISRDDFAKSIGVSAPTVSNWCGNRNVPRDPEDFSKKMSEKFPGSTKKDWYEAIMVTKRILEKNKGAGR